jgi:hypothetical protein
VATTVDEDQRTAGTEVAQVEQRQTTVVEAGARGVFRDDRARERRNIGEHVDDARETRVHHLFTRHLNERRGSSGWIALDARAGDDDFLEKTVIGIRWLLGRRGRLRRSEGSTVRQHGGNAPIRAPRLTRVMSDPSLVY